MKLKNVLLVAQINITQQKHKAKIVNIKQSRDLGVWKAIQNKSKANPWSSALGFQNLQSFYMSIKLQISNLKIRSS